MTLRDETSEQLYRFLDLGELIEAGDECPSDSCDHWEPVNRWAIGSPRSAIFKIIRRRASLSPAATPVSEAGGAAFRVTKRGAFVEHEPLLPAFDLPDGTYDLHLAKPASSPAGGDVLPGLRAEIAHDGFAGDIIGRYVTREGRRGVVIQQDGTRVVHVYGEKWLPVETQFALSESALTPADLQLLMQLQRDNRHDGARPVISQQPVIDQACRLSEGGLIALEQVAQGVRLHITRKGAKAIPAILYTAGES